jgi:positive phototaxis protein PixI
MGISLDELISSFESGTAAIAGGLLDQAAPTESTQEKFLQFCLQGDEMALLPVSGIAEVLKIPMTEVLPVPQMPRYVLGLYNRRGEMLWLMDLAHFVGYPPTFQAGSAFAIGMAIVLDIQGQQLGLVVPRIHDIEWHDPQHLQAPTMQLFSSKLLPFVQGYLSESGTSVLDPLAIAQALT